MTTLPTGVIITTIGVLLLLTANVFDENTALQIILSVSGAVIALAGVVVGWRYKSRHENGLKGV